jgi:SAM-dependent methyltransferase
VTQSPADRLVGLYREGAADWIETRGRTASAPETVWFDRFVAALPPGGRVLDVGCGSGWPHAARLIEQGFRVTGADSAGPLLDHARATLPTGEWIEADMRSMDLGDRLFDGVVAWWSLFHLSPEDQQRLLPDLAIRVAPGGALMIAVGDRHGEAIGEWRGEPLYHGSLALDAYRALLSEAGLDPINGPLSDQPGERGVIWLAKRAMLSAK